ncbi:MAG TPA: hypothetical protein VGF81_08090 [Solirubrobacteraceae bacterium]|jgi:hypothetical protein
MITGMYTVDVPVTDQDGAVEFCIEALGRARTGGRRAPQRGRDRHPAHHR